MSPFLPAGVRWIAGALLLIAAAAGCEQQCRPGTLFLDVNLGTIRNADHLDIDVTIGSVKKMTLKQPLVAGTTGGGYEIDFAANGYPAGASVSVTVSAKTEAGVLLGDAAQTFNAASGCSHLTFKLTAPGGGGTGGMTGAGGHAAGVGGTSGSGGKGLGGAQGSGGAMGAGGSNGTGGRGATGGAAGTGGAGGMVAGCDPGFAPTGALIADFSTADASGAPVIPGGGLYSYQTASTAASPTVAVEAGKLHVKLSAPAGVTTQYAGFGIFFDTCVDATLAAYSGVKFTVSGSLSAGCSMQFAHNFSQDAYYVGDPKGSCTAGASQCYAPSTALTVGAVPANVTVGFGEVTGGNPITAVDATRLTGPQWQFNVPPAGCTADIVLDDVTFVPHVVDHTFDASDEGFGLSDFDPAGIDVNLGAPGSGSAPTIALDPTTGAPSPSSLEVTVHFTDYHQYVDVILPIDVAMPLDLTDRLLHAQIRLTSGSLSNGGVQLHASSTTTYLYGATNFMTLAPDQWTDLPLDMRKVDTPGWDPRQIVQLGVQIISGGEPGDGTPYPDTGDAVFHIDTLSD